MRRLHALFHSLSIIILLLFLPGCWDRREINELAFISSLAFDLENDECIVTAEIIRPAAVTGGGEGGGGGGTAAALPQRNAIIAIDRGNTLYAAGRKLALRLPRRAYVAHTTGVLVGEDLARQGLKEVLDFLDRQQEFRRSTFILLTRGPAKEVLIRAQGGLEATLGREIAGLDKWVRVSGYGFIPSIHDVLVDLSTGAAATAIPVLELSPQPFPPVIGAPTSRGATSRESNKQGAPRTPEPEIVRTVRLNGTGLFHHDKLVGWLDERQTRGLAWVRNQVNRAILELQCPEDKKRISVEITEARSKTKFQDRNSQLQSIINLKVEGNLLEQQCFHDYTSEEAIKSLESQMAIVITEEINSAIAQAKKAGTDVFDFGGALYRKNPKLWKQIQPHWEEEFKKLPITIQVEVKLRRTGLTGRPWQPKAH
ncbi:spore germination protein KC [Thermanaeromonas toyohensis ToBE]|uniref:Spore germination protein KC n=1 Tax=Thermanaeromonas toyohensis ToBE TaxID=698762 RepID=A0A1W1VFW6_9FIRM|nr:Ger(x)C family spore germination protein [Thermanaeromonas toyohensis]SMB92299.1 spore germination protein KC [Thermanaeromonas toyohensis ToBE]